jgi:hypothetical protein
MTSACEPYNLGSSTTVGIRVIIIRTIVVLLHKTSKRFGSNEVNCYFGLNCSDLSSFIPAFL